MKHIKFTATPVGPKFDQVEVQIVEQSHIRNEFGISGSDRFKANNGMELRSIACPKIYSDYICVRGDCTYRDNDKLIFTTSEYNKFREAVEEYNSYFKQKPKSKKPQRLRVHAEAIGPDFKNVSVEVVEQSHFEGQFGECRTNGVGEFIYGKVRLCSTLGGSGVNMDSFIPSRYKDKDLIGTFYVANKKTKEDKDSLKTVVTVEVWQEILKTVEAFNKEFWTGEVEEEVAEKEVKKPDVPKKRWFIRTVDFVHSNYATKKGTVAEFISLGHGWVNVRLSNGKSESWTEKNCKEISEAELAERFVEEKPEVQKDRYFVRTKSVTSLQNFAVGLVGKVVKESNSGRSVTVVLPNGQTSNWLKTNCVEITEIPVVEKKRWFVRTTPNHYASASTIASVGTVGEFVLNGGSGVHVKVPSGKTEFWDAENCVEIQDLPL